MSGPPSATPGDPPWWTTAVFYQIYPRSFCDTTGNGIGDLEGIRARLDHLVSLGIDAIWISPFYPSPMADHGYDVADYCDVDPMFGSLETFDALLADAHDRGLRVIVDWVPAHTSDQHPWFVASRSSTDNPKRDWYLWAGDDPDRPPTDWQATFPAGPAWTWDDTTSAWYSHTFTPQQPDLNWSNPEVQEAMLDTLRFWLDRGVDGLRMDVIHHIGRHHGRIADQAESATDPEHTHRHLRRIRELIDGYDGARVAVGETWILDTHEVATYYGHDDELHLCHNFRPQFAPWAAPEWRGEIDAAAAAFDPIGAWPTWLLSNHDIWRMATRYQNEAIVRCAAVVLLTLRGTPFIYAGDEFGLADADVPPEQVEDPAGFRDGCRAPVPWDQGPNHGWRRPDNWLPWPPEADTRNAAAQTGDPASVLELYRRLLMLRRSTPALHRGDQARLELGGDVVGWERTHHGERRIVLVNFGASPVDSVLADAGDDWTVALGTDPSLDGRRFDGRVAAHAAVVLEPTAS